MSPFAPHLAEELWRLTGHERSLSYEPWPTYDEALCVDDILEIPVQVNGKLRDTLTAPRGLDRAAVEELALSSGNVQRQLAGASPRKIIVVPDRLVNIVA